MKGHILGIAGVVAGCDVTELAELYPETAGRLGSRPLSVSLMHLTSGDSVKFHTELTQHS
jgi:hypothetical protein